MIDLSSYERAMAALPRDMTHAEVNAERINEITIKVKCGEIVDSKAFTRTRLYVRAGAEHTGTVYTEDLDKDAMAVLHQALENSRFSNTAAPEPMNEGIGESISCQFEDEGVEEMLRFCAAAENAAGSERVTECCVTAISREMRTLNSLGFDASSKTRHIAASLSVNLERRGSYSVEGEAYISAKSLLLMSAEALAKAAIENAESIDGGGLPAIQIPCGKYDVVLSAHVMRNILMTAWQAFSGELIGKGASCFKGAGEMVGSRVLTLINAPTHPMLGQQWLMDSEGTVVKETTIVEKGVIVMPLYTLSSGVAAGQYSTGSAGRTARMTGDLPITLTTVPALIYFKPEDVARAQLISRMNTGLLLTYSLDLFHSINVASGAFSIPCGGVYYENGRPIGTISQMTMVGSLNELWTNIEAVGSDLGFDDFYLKTYCVGSPSALARGLIFTS